MKEEEGSGQRRIDENRKIVKENTPKGNKAIKENNDGRSVNLFDFLIHKKTLFTSLSLIATDCKIFM